MDEINRIILEVTGRQKVAELTAELAKHEQALQDLGEYYRKNAHLADQFEAAQRLVASKIQEINQELASLAPAAAQAGAQLGRQGQFGQGVLQASYAVQDFTSVLGTQGLGRALSAIQNNIPGLLMALGKGAGLAGIISLVAVGVGVLYDNWDTLAKLWGGGGTDEEKERMKELAKATKEAADAAERLQKMRPPEEQETAAALKRAVQAFGGPAVLEELRKEILQTGAWGEAAKDMAKVLFQNLMAGRPEAERFLREQAVPTGQVGRVIRGAPTPEQERQASIKRGAELNRIADAAAAHAKQQRDKELEAENREAKRLREKAEKDREHERKLAEQKLADDVREGRRAEAQVNRQIRQPLRGVAAPTPLREMPMGPVSAEQQHAILENEEALARSQRDLAEFNRRNGNVRREIGRVTDMLRQPMRLEGHP